VKGYGEQGNKGTGEQGTQGMEQPNLGRTDSQSFNLSIFQSPNLSISQSFNLPIFQSFNLPIFFLALPAYAGPGYPLQSFSRFAQKRISATIPSAVASDWEGIKSHPKSFAFKNNTFKPTSPRWHME
jgi:hypothetical protein